MSITYVVKQAMSYQNNASLDKPEYMGIVMLFLAYFLLIFCMLGNFSWLTFFFSN